MIKWTITIAVVLFVFLGIAAVDAQVHATLPQLKSGASVNIGVPVDFKILDQRVSAIYDLVESDESHIVWKFTGSTGDWAFVFADGRIVIANTVDFNLATKDALDKELNDVIDMLNVVSPGLVTADARNNALESAIYYASEQEIYHRIKYTFNSNFDFKLVVPDCTIKQARLSVSGNDGNGQAYFIDGKEVVSCHTTYTNQDCGVSPTEITDKIPTGIHSITAGSIQWQHTMILEVITATMPPKNFVLYGPNYQPWINETSKSMNLRALLMILGSDDIANCTEHLPGGIVGIDPTSHPKVKVNVFVNTSCAKSGDLKKEDFKVEENDKDATIDSVYFSGNASGKGVDLAVVFDDTGSMQPQIDAMKSKVQSLTDQIKDAGIDVRYALVTFKDNVSVKTNWTNDPKVFQNSVNALKAIGGEDEPEDSLDAIERIISMGFRPDAQRIILVITDAHAHYKGDGTTYSMYTKDEVMSDLRKNGIIFIPVSPTFKTPTEAVDLRDIANEIQSMWIDMNSANFSGILENFKQIITGTYVIEYVSPDVTPSTTRTVAVKVDKPGCVMGCASASYTTKS